MAKRSRHVSKCTVFGEEIAQAQVDVMVTFSTFSFLSFDPHDQSVACEQFMTRPTPVGLDWREFPEENKNYCTVVP